MICLLVGEAYPTEYVYKLHNMVDRFCTQQYDFICYTDKKNIPNIRTAHIPDTFELDPLWYKLRMLDHPTFNLYNRKIFLDLDIVVHNNIDWLFDYKINKLHVLKSKWKPDHIINLSSDTGCNSSVMLWENSEKLAHMFESNKLNIMCKYRGIDRFLWKEARSEWEFIDNNEVYSFREGADYNDHAPFVMREDRSICIYHQHPKPHEVLNIEPAKSFWK